MTPGFEELQRLSKENVDKAVVSLGAVQKGFQALTAELTEGSKKAYEANSAFVQELFGAKTLDKAIELQTAFAKASYEAFVAQATKLNEIAVDAAKDAVKK